MSGINTILRLIALAVALHGGRAPAAANGELDMLLARDTAEIVTNAGRTHRGTLDGFRDGRLHLRLASDGGEVGYSFAPTEIARLKLPGADLEADAVDLLDQGRTSEAMPMLEAIGRQRVRYLPVLNEAQQQVLWRLAQTGGASGDPHTMLGIVRAMAPLATTEETRATLLETELRVVLRLNQSDEAQTLARRWCAFADPAGASALGWRVLAQAAYDAGDYDRARWIALQPVTFSSHLAASDLDTCYALAIASADRLGETDRALILSREMKARSISWPPDPALKGLAAHYATAGDETSPRLRPYFPPAVAPLRDEPATSLESARRLVSPSPLP